MRPFLESLTKLDDGSNVFSQKCINFKGFATLNLLDIVPHDSEGKLELPSQPSKHQLTSLLEAVRRNTESFATLAVNANVAINPYFHNLHQVRSLLDRLRSMGDSASVYESLSQRVNALMRTYGAYMCRFLKDDRHLSLNNVIGLYESIFKREYIDDIFYLLQNIEFSESSQSLVDFLFALAKSEGDVNLLWDFYVKSASTSQYIPLPTTTHLSNPNFISDLFIEFVKDRFKPGNGSFHPAWLGQFAKLMLYRLLTPEQAMAVATALQPLLAEAMDSIAKSSYLLRFCFGVFANPDLLNYDDSNHGGFFSGFVNNFIIHDIDERREFFAQLWNKTVGVFDNFKLGSVSEITTVVTKLESALPGIVKTLKLPFVDQCTFGNDAPTSTMTLFNFTDAIETQDELEKRVEVFEFILPILRARPVMLMRDYGTAVVVKALDDTVFAVAKTSQVLEIDRFASLVLQFCTVLFDQLNVTCEISSEDCLRNWLKFASAYDSAEEVQEILRFLFYRLVEDRNVLNRFYELILHWANVYPQKFCPNESLSLFTHEFPMEGQQFASSIVKLLMGKGFVDERLFRFIARAFLLDVLSSEDAMDVVNSIRQFDPDNILQMSSFQVLVYALSGIQFPMLNLSVDTLLEFDISTLQVQPEKFLKAFFDYFSDHVVKIANFLSLSKTLFPRLFFSRLIMIPSLTFPSAQESQFPSLRTPLPKSSQETVRFLLELLFSVYKTGVTLTDLQSIYDTVMEIRTIQRDAQKDMGTLPLFLELITFVIRLFALRFQPSAFNSDQIIALIKDSETPALIDVSGAELVFNALPVEMKKEVFTAFASIYYRYGNQRQVFRTEFFSIFDAQERTLVLKNLLGSLMGTGPLPLHVAKLFCFLMKHDLLDGPLIVTMLDGLATLSSQVDFITFSALRIIFTKPSLARFRSTALIKLLLPQHYGYYNMAQLPACSPSITFFSDFMDDVHLSKWLDSLPSYFSQSIRDNVAFYRARWVNVKPAFSLKCGFERVIKAYHAAITDLHTFDMTLSRKLSLFNSTFADIDYLLENFNSNGMAVDEYSSQCPETFVDLAVRLVSLIILDKTSRHQSLCLSTEYYDKLVWAIKRFVRRADLQADLHHCLCVSSYPVELQKHIAATSPKLVGTTFPLSAQALKSLSHFKLTAEERDQFFNSVINNAFSTDGSGSVASRFFQVMAEANSLISLPDCYNVTILRKIIENAQFIDVDSQSLMDYFQAVITEKVHVKTVNPDIPKFILHFLQLRNDIIGSIMNFHRPGTAMDVGHKLLKYAKKAIDQCPMLKYLISVMTVRSYDFNSRKDILDNPTIWRRNAILHWACVWLQYSRTDCALKFLSLIPDDLDVDSASEVVLENSWFKVLTAIFDKMDGPDFKPNHADFTDDVIRRIIVAMKFAWHEKKHIFWKILRSFKSTQSTTPLKLLSELVKSELFAMIVCCQDSASRFFYEVRKWSLFKKKIGTNTFWLLTVHSDSESTLSSGGLYDATKQAIERLKTSTSQNILTNLQEMHGLLQQIPVYNSLPLVRSCIDSAVKVFGSNGVLFRSDELFETIYELGTHLGAKLAVLAESHEVVVFLRALYETVDSGSNMAHFNESVFTLGCFLNSHDSVKDFLYQVLLARFTQESCVLPHKLPPFLLSDFNDLFVAFFKDVIDKLRNQILGHKSGTAFDFDGSIVEVLLHYLLALDNVPDDHFLSWSIYLFILQEPKYSSLSSSFTDDLKILISTRRHLIPDFASKIMAENVLLDFRYMVFVPLLKLIFQHDRTSYHIQYNRLPPNIRAKLDSSVGNELVAKKQLLIFDLAKKHLSSGDVDQLLKLDVSILTAGQRLQLCATLDSITTGDLMHKVSAYSKIDCPIPTHLLKQCERESVALTNDKFLQFVSMMEREAYQPNIGYIVKCLSWSPSESNVRKLLPLLPLKPFVDAMIQERICFADSLLLHILQHPDCDGYESAIPFLSTSAHRLLQLLKFK